MQTSFSLILHNSMESVSFVPGIRLQGKPFLNFNGYVKVWKPGSPSLKLMAGVGHKLWMMANPSSKWLPMAKKQRSNSSFQSQFHATKSLKGTLC
jgi:hypothetical protein